MSSDLRVLPPEDSGPSFLGGVYSLLTGGFQGLVDSMADKVPKYPPLEVLPCANVNVNEYTVCKKPGKMACSSCKLVSYCSKECQKAHWAIHKSDCKDPIRSSDWKPAWVVEHRSPSFINPPGMSAAEEYASRFRNEHSVGVSLWGNVPALDIVNLQNNERDPKTDLSLAFTASGDIRNVVATINGLGSEYSGKLNILLNDLNPHVASRNITLLLILGMIPDEVIAADIALHFWYSVFMPMEYRFRIMTMVSTFLKKSSPDGLIVTPLGSHSMLNCMISPTVSKLLMDNVGPVISLDQAQVEYKRVRKAPSRVDFRDRMYMGLKPSHRLAFLEYRRFGILLPFGAVNAHFNVPNPSLFSDGMWLQTDYADPLESWDLNKVFSAGRAHGAQPEDVYGCLYFFLSDQLREFARNIRQRHITFRLFNVEARGLAQTISQGILAELGLPSSIRFDRIDVSNIIDQNYVGLPDMVNAWEPFLAKTNNAALTGYFMNWAASVEKGRVEYAGFPVISSAMELMMKKKRIRTDVDPTLSVFLAMHDIDAFYDNSKPFANYWKSYGGTDIKLQLRSINKIFPQRLGTVVGAKPSALPDLANDETWYRYTRLINMTWTERFVELVRKRT